LIELCTALDEMHVRVVKSRQQQFAASIDHFGLRPAPQINVRAGADGHNAISDHGDCFGFWLLFIYRVNGSVSYNQTGRRFRLRVRRDVAHKHEKNNREIRLHHHGTDPENIYSTRIGLSQGWYYIVSDHLSC
jgi:hypothetical protein